MITTEEEYLLIDRILLGERNLYTTLVDKYKSYAYTIAMKVLENRADAEEAAQDAFVKAFHYLKGFNRQAKFSTWLYRIVFNVSISYKRKRKVEFQNIESSIIEYSERADTDTEQHDKNIFISKALNKLNEADRLAIQLFYMKEFNLEEVAEMMGQNINTVKVRIHRARLRLADELKTLLKEEALTL